MIFHRVYFTNGHNAAYGKNDNIELWLNLQNSLVIERSKDSVAAYPLGMPGTMGLGVKAYLMGPTKEEAEILKPKEELGLKGEEYSFPEKAQVLTIVDSGKKKAKKKKKKKKKKARKKVNNGPKPAA